MIGSIQGGSTAVRHPSPKRMFKRMDANGDGSLDQSELASLAKRKGTDAASLLGSLDTDKDGKVNAQELGAGMAKQSQTGSQAQVGSGASEFTTAMMGILKQLQDSQNGDGATAADGGNCDNGNDGSQGVATVELQFQMTVKTQGGKGHGHHSHGEMFAKMDANGDGTLDETELGGIAAKTGKDASQILTDLDTDGDGKVSKTEMDAGAAKRKQAMQAQNDGGAPRNPMAEITTTLMNILKQLQESQDKNGTDASTETASTGSAALALA